MAPPGVGSSTQKRPSVASTADNDIVVLDGGFATQLSCHVSQQIDGDVLWSARFLATDKEAVIDAHLDFLRGMVVNGGFCRRRPFRDCGSFLNKRMVE